MSDRHIRCKNYEGHLAESPIQTNGPPGERLFVVESLAFAKGWRKEKSEFAWLCPKCIERFGEDTLVPYWGEYDMQPANPNESKPDSTACYEELHWRYYYSKPRGTLNKSH